MDTDELIEMLERGCEETRQARRERQERAAARCGDYGLAVEEQRAELEAPARRAGFTVIVGDAS